MEATMLAAKTPTMESDRQEAVESGRAGILAATNIAAMVALLLLLPVSLIDGFKPLVLVVLLWLVLTSVVSSYANLRGRYLLGTYVFLIGISAGLFAAMIVPTELTPTWRDAMYLVPLYFFALPVLAAGGLLFPAAAFGFAGAGTVHGLGAALIRSEGAFLGVPGHVASLAAPSLLLFLVAGVSWFYGSNMLGSILRARQRSVEIERMTDELRASNQSLADAFASVRQLAEQMEETAQHLSVASAELSATSRQQASGASQQAASVAEVSATVEELSRTAAQIAQSAEQTLSSAEDGRSAVDDTMEGMEAIKGSVESTTERILQLGESSQRIGEITDIISDIAGKTHLLALNAAIESAAAGDFGRRFAVVAQQVKVLADETKDATVQVKQVIVRTQSGTNASVVATEQATKQVERGIELAKRARHAIEEIVQRAETITMATHQQQTASEQTVSTVRDIADVARQTATSSQQLSDSAGELASFAQQLRDAVARLKGGTR